VTEIPEHLLKRSRERRAQLTGGAADSGESSASTESAGETTPVAAAAPSAPAATGPQPRGGGLEPATAPPPKPDSPVVAAAKSRRRIPFWAMAALSLMPVWGFMYVRALTEEPEVAAGPLAVGTEVYGSCAGCHGGSGEGGVGRPFADGEVLATFPHIEDQLRFVYFGTEAYEAADVDVYGDPNREGGAHETGSIGPMPPQEAELTDAEILGVVCHERYDLGGADPTSEEYETEYEHWCAEESPIFEALESETVTLTALGPDAGIVDAEGTPIEIMPIGEEPIAGSPADG
jgi:mono/diheme cytochrome c family protein